MADGKEISEWNRTCEILSLIHNTNCAEESDTIYPWQKHPYYSDYKKPQQKARPEELEILKLEIEKRYVR